MRHFETSEINLVLRLSNDPNDIPSQLWRESIPIRCISNRCQITVFWCDNISEIAEYHDDQNNGGSGYNALQEKVIYVLEILKWNGNYWWCEMSVMLVSVLAHLRTDWIWNSDVQIHITLEQNVMNTTPFISFPNSSVKLLCYKL